MWDSERATLLTEVSCQAHSNLHAACYKHCTVDSEADKVHKCFDELHFWPFSVGAPKERRQLERMSERMRQHVHVPLFRATIRPGSQLVQGTRTLLFCPPATPSNCQRIDDETHIFRPSSARSGPHPSVATSLPAPHQT